MSIIKYILIVSAMVVFLSICSPDPLNFGFQAVTYAGEQADSMNFIRPSTTMLYNAISLERSLISKKIRLKVADLIAAMDKAHQNCLEKDSIIFLQSSAQLLAWVNKATAHCPKRTPLCERTILSALYLQIDMLDRALWNQNQSKAVNLRNQRRLVRVRNETDRFFGDSRDTFICILLDTLKNINELQVQFGPPQKTDWNFPKNAKSFSEIEGDLLNKFQLVTDTAIAVSK